MTEYIIYVCPATQDTHPLHIGLFYRYLVVSDINIRISLTLASTKVKKFSKLLNPEIS